MTQPPTLTKKKLEQKGATWENSQIILKYAKPQ